MATTSVQPQKNHLTNSTSDFTEIRRFFSFLFIILIAAACLYFTLAATTPKFNRAEVFFAECAREMLHNHNFVTPLYHNKPFFDKPILTYWCILGCFKLLGISHLVARIPSILAAVFTVIISTLGIAFVCGIEAGLLTAMVLASSVMFVSFAGLCMSDMLLVMFDTATMVLLFTGTLFYNQRTALWWLGALSIGLAFLTKGPVGLVLPVVAFLAYLTATKQLSLIQLKHLLIGTLTIIVVNIPWFLAALKLNGSGALYYFFVHENLQRFAGSTYDTHRPIWFMFSSLFAGFLPWSILLPAVFYASIRKLFSGIGSTRLKLELYLLLWIFCVIGFFSISRGKIDYYALPAYPACAALCGMYLSDWIRQKNKFVALTAMVFALGSISLGVLYWQLLPTICGVPPSYFMLLPAIPVIAGMLSLLAVTRNKLTVAFGMIFISIILTGIVFCVQITPVFSNLQAPLEFTSIIKRSTNNTQIGMYKNVDNWIDEMTFQTGIEPIKLNNPAELAKFISSPVPAYAIIPKDAFYQLPEQVVSKIIIVAQKPFMTHSLNPGYVLKHKGHLADDTLLLITNRTI